MTRQLTTALVLFVSTVVCSQALQEIALPRLRDDNEWKVISIYQELPIHASNKATSNLVGMKPAGAVLHGRRVGDWLKLAKEPGYIRLPNQDEEGVVVEQQPRKLIRRESKKAEAFYDAKAKAKAATLLLAETKNKPRTLIRKAKKMGKTTEAQKIPHPLVRSAKQNVHAKKASPAKATSTKVQAPPVKAAPAQAALTKTAPTKPNPLDVGPWVAEADAQKAAPAQAALTKPAPTKPNSLDVGYAKADPHKAAPAQEIQKAGPANNDPHRTLVAEDHRAAAAEKVGVDKAALSKATEEKAAAEKVVEDKNVIEQLATERLAADQAILNATERRAADQAVLNAVKLTGDATSEANKIQNADAATVAVQEVHQKRHSKEKVRALIKAEKKKKEADVGQEHSHPEKKQTHETAGKEQQSAEFATNGVIASSSHHHHQGHRTGALKEHKVWSPDKGLTNHQDLVDQQDQGLVDHQNL